MTSCRRFSYSSKVFGGYGALIDDTDPWQRLPLPSQSSQSEQSPRRRLSLHIPKYEDEQVLVEVPCDLYSTSPSRTHLHTKQIQISSSIYCSCMLYFILAGYIETRRYVIIATSGRNWRAKVDKTTMLTYPPQGAALVCWDKVANRATTMSFVNIV